MRSVILLALWVSGVCNAGNLVVNGRITKVTNTYFNEASFAITVGGWSSQDTHALDERKGSSTVLLNEKRPSG